MIAVLAAVAVGIISAVLPFTPVEPYLVAVTAAGHGQPIALGLAAAVGQTAGKLTLFLASRGAVRVAWLRRKLDSVRRAGRHRRPPPDRPWPSAALLAVSAVTGLPPLLASTVYFGTTRMRPAVFTAVCLVGRAIRFIAVAYLHSLA
jgi:membrane protein YqaA with SNARE-associated domain